MSSFNPHNLLNTIRPPETIHLGWHDPERVRPPIRKGVPMPPKKVVTVRQWGEGAMLSYAWEDMEVGDSFQAYPRHDRPQLAAAAHAMGLKLDRTFSVRTQDDGTMAVWRTA